LGEQTTSERRAERFVLVELKARGINFVRNRVHFVKISRYPTENPIQVFFKEREQIGLKSSNSTSPKIFTEREISPVKKPTMWRLVGFLCRPVYQAGLLILTNRKTRGRGY